mmetsp:Transcript_121379/g.343483  ORF Transcript_121379/g.343483 Transcript_121379/m.343483 type:complete len:213 (-) Transcript_121379:2127-2765(-)
MLVALIQAADGACKGDNDHGQGPEEERELRDHAAADEHIGRDPVAEDGQVHEQDVIEKHGDHGEYGVREKLQSLCLGAFLSEEHAIVVLHAVEDGLGADHPDQTKHQDEARDILPVQQVAGHTNEHELRGQCLRLAVRLYRLRDVLVQQLAEPENVDERSEACSHVAVGPAIIVVVQVRDDRLADHEDAQGEKEPGLPVRELEHRDANPYLV